MRLKLLATALAGIVSTAPAMAAESIGGGGCASDLSFSGGSSLVSCYGRFSKNVLNNASNDEINTALDALGFAGTDVRYNLVPLGNILSLRSDQGASVNFPGLLNGTVFVGIHTGGGGRNGVGNQTSFYKINAVNLDAFTLRPSGGSTATLLAVSASAVPEPAAWVMMIVGVAMTGFSLRRRQARVNFA